MNLEHVDSGDNVPSELNVIIEIPANSDPVKYELDKKTGAMYVDRFMSTAMHYPCNYGYVPRTLSKDGDPVDVLVLTPYPLIPGSVVKCRPVGVLKMTDESGDDAKVLAVPIDKQWECAMGTGNVIYNEKDGKWYAFYTDCGSRIQFFDKRLLTPGALLALGGERLDLGQRLRRARPLAVPLVAHLVLVLEQLPLELLGEELLVLDLAATVGMAVLGEAEDQVDVR